MSIDTRLQRVWYSAAPSSIALILLPLSWLFASIVGARRVAYRWGIFRSAAIGRPVIVVGNITVGGTGKTPFTVWLAKALQQRGHRVAIILRGYGGRSTHWPRDVAPESSWDEVGDEAVLLASATGAIVVAGPDRVAAARRAVERGADLILSDDGLQHYRLARDCEIVVCDAQRGLGNGRMLPAGPLREPASRLDEVSLIVITQRAAPSADQVRSVPSTQTARIAISQRLMHATALTSRERKPLQSFAGQRIHAIAAIGNPQAFFAALTGAGLQVEGRALPDHARLTREDIMFADDAPVLMTEKDAVKCRDIADHRHWSIAMEIEIGADDAAVVHSVLERALAASEKI